MASEFRARGEYGERREQRLRGDWWGYATDGGGGGGARAERSLHPATRDYYSHYDHHQPNGHHSRALLKESPEWWTEERRPATSTLEALLRGSMEDPVVRIKTENGGSRPKHRGEPSSPSVAPRGRGGRACVTLTEADRADIMARIRRGEKQADLAKEYRVSRAAITNLKQRRQMLEMMARNGDAREREEARKRLRLPDGGERGGDEEEQNATERVETDAMKLGRQQSVETEDEPDAGTSPSVDRPDVNQSDPGDRPSPPQRLHELATATTCRLFSKLLDARTPDDALRSTASRLTRLLLEEAVGRSYLMATNHNGGHNVDGRVQYNPVALAFGVYEAPRLVREYAQLEPLARTALAWPLAASTTGETTEVVVRVPTVVRCRSPVLIFLDDALDLQRLPLTEWLFALHALVFMGIPEPQILVVLNVCPASIALSIVQRFPQIHAVATRLLSTETPQHELELMAAYQRRQRRLWGHEE